LSKQSIIARGAMTLSLVGAASLAMSAAAGANVVLRPAGKSAIKPATQYTGKRPFLVRGPRVNQTNLLVLGGGATLPAIAYVGVAAATSNTQPATTPSSTSVLGQFAALAPVPVIGSSALGWTASYCQTGSGNGKKIMNGVDAQGGASEACGTPPGTFAAGANDFSGPTNTSDLADFAGSDAPLALSEYTPLAAHYPGRGEFVQVPFIAGAVSIAFHNADVTTNTLKLTIPEICKIADGEINNWDEIPESAAGLGTGNPTLPVSTTNPGLPPKAITFFYRSDNSGTTFSFTNFLSAQATSTGARLHCTGSTETWGMNQNFLAALPVSPAPSNFMGASGNGGVITAIDATDGAIGYAEAANALAASTHSTYFSKVFTVAVNSPTFLKDPIADLPAAAYFVNTFKKDYVVNFSCGNTAAVGGSNCPSTTAVGRFGGGTADIAAIPSTDIYKAGCVGIVDPQAYEAPALGYPIIAVSNLEFYASGNGVYTSGLRYLADMMAEYQGGTHVLGPTPNMAGSVDKAGLSVVGTTGFSALGINDVFYSNSVIGLIPNCIN